MEEEYQRALDYLYGFINFEQNPLDRYQASKIDTARPRALLALLGNPHERFPSIHIAGTKGKGSVAAMCAQCLRLAGLRVGLYTSPHLQEFRERIRVLTPQDADGRISQADFVALMDRVRAVIDDVPGITWFEIVTAVAFVQFANDAVDVAVVEVGLGGRLDATNVLTPEVSVITSLSLDHTQLLGDTLAEIAFEKGGIIKTGIPLVSASQSPEAQAVLEALVEERGTTLDLIGRDWRYEGLQTPGNRFIERGLVITHSRDPSFIPDGTRFSVALPGAHQLENATVALGALAHVHEKYPSLSVPILQAGLATVRWDGRLQVLDSGAQGPRILVDCAHNKDSTARLIDALQNDFDYHDLYLVFGAPADKDILSMIQSLFPLAREIFVTAADHPRAASPEWLAGQAAELGYHATPVSSVDRALAAALQLAGPDDLVCATGSIILIGDLLNHWELLQSARTHDG